MKRMSQKARYAAKAAFQKERGFTIVELLIVIVVIGILAAISIVAYNGVSQSAKNTATIAAAKQAVNAINLYITEQGTYPATGNRCLTTGQPCNWGANEAEPNAAFQNLLKDYGGLPASVAATSSSDYGGIYYSYSTGRTFNGTTNFKPAAVVFALNGTSQKCQLPNVGNSGGSAMNTSTSGFTANSGGATVCIISIDGPPPS